MPKEKSLLYQFDQLSKNVLGTNVEEQKTDPESKHAQHEKEKAETLNKIFEKYSITEREFFNGVQNGFNQATQSGPLCEEEMFGTCFLVQQITMEQQQDTQNQEEDVYGPFAGQVISIVKQLCKRSMINAEPRLMEGTYLCNLLTQPDTYGLVYGIINKCRGTVVSEEVQEGTNFFILDLKLPLVESFIFNDEVRRKCQGIAYP